MTDSLPHTATDGIARDALWQRLANWSPDAPGDVPLHQRMAQDNGWTAAHTRRVIEEYRRFLWLAVRHRGEVCPSDAVDEAWHAHLLHSRHYFDHFCPNVLGRTLHHFPNTGGAAHHHLHRQRYADTLRRYAEAFGDAPPPDIWPGVEARFAARARRVNTATHWVLPRPRWPAHGLPRSLRGLMVLLALPALLFSGCVPVTLHPDWSGERVLAIYGLCFAAWVALGVVLVLRAPGGSPRASARPEPLDALELAYLAGGSARSVHTGLARLLQQGHLALRASSGTWRTTTQPPAHANPLEQTLHAQIAQGLQPGAGLGLFEARRELDTLHQRLLDRGLVHAPGRDQRRHQWRDRLYFYGWLGLLVWGGLRFVHGVQHGHPVVFLFFLLLLALVSIATFRKRLPHRLTREGQAAVREARSRLRRRDALGLKDAQMPLALALLGTGVLAANLQPLKEALVQTGGKDTGGSGCGASGGGSDGGGGDGGGCGGCGGGGGD